MPFPALTYEDILNTNLWCQQVVADNIKPTYGIRDDNLLRSISESVVQSFDGIDLYPTVYDKCSYLWYSLSQYHCFIDGNKRTALITTILSLMLNGFHFETKANDLYDKCISLASSKISRDDILRYLIRHTSKADVISKNINELLDYLSKDSRLINILEKLGQ